MRRTTVISAVFFALVLGTGSAPAQEAQRYSSNDGLQVIGTAQEFEILTLAGRGKAHYFCAAGRFARKVLGARNTDRLIVKSGRTSSLYQRNRLAVVFALTGPNAPRPSVTRVGGPRRGQNASVGHANALCNQAGLHVSIQ